MANLNDKLRLADLELNKALHLAETNRDKLLQEGSTQILFFFLSRVIHVLCHVTLASVSPGRIKKIFDRNVCKVIIQRP